MVLAYNSWEVLHGDWQVEETGDSGDGACGPGGWHGLPLHPATPPPPPFTILFTPPPILLNPTLLHQPHRAKGALPSPSSPPAPWGLPNSCFSFSFSWTERDLHLVPLLTPPFPPSFQQRKALHPQLQTCPTGSPWKSIGKTWGPASPAHIRAKHPCRMPGCGGGGDAVPRDAMKAPNQ